MSNQHQLISPTMALPGRETPVPITELHFVNHTCLTTEKPNSYKEILVGMGCFWGAERLFWSVEGVYSTSVGYSGGYTPNPTYDEVCSGQTGHAEVVRIIFDPHLLSLSQLLQLFWENHDPTQGMRQGNDRGTQYRSVIFTENEADAQTAVAMCHQYQLALEHALRSQQSAQKITTEISIMKNYYLAETYHQQYLAKNPNGYCGIGGTGVCFPIVSDTHF